MLKRDKPATAPQLPPHPDLGATAASKPSLYTLLQREVAAEAAPLPSRSPPPASPSPPPPGTEGEHHEVHEGCVALEDVEVSYRMIWPQTERRPAQPLMADCG